MARFQPLLLLAPAFVAMAWLIYRAQWFWSNNPDLQFGWVVVLLCAYLFWESWEVRPEINWKPRVWTVLLAIAGLGVLFLVQIYEASLGANAASTVGLALGAVLVATSNLGLVFGWAGVRAFGMAFGFILIAMPMPSAVQGPIVGGLQNKVAWINTEILNLLGIPAQQVGSLIHLPNGTVGIDEACSGVRSLQSTIMATLFIGYVSLKHNGLRMVLLGLGMALAVLGNVGRSLYLCLMAYWKGIDSIEKVHDAAGWSVLAFTAAGVVLLAWLIGKAERAMTMAMVEEAHGQVSGGEGDDAAV